MFKQELVEDISRFNHNAERKIEKERGDSRTQFLQLKNAKLCTAQAVVGEQLDFRIEPLSCFLPSVIFETFGAQGRAPRISECHIMPPGFWNKGHRHEQSPQLDGREGGCY